MPTAAIVQLGRRGDIVSALPMAYRLHQQGHAVDWYAHPDFAAGLLDAVGYVNVVPVTTTHRDVRATAERARVSGRYDLVLATQVDGNELPAPADGESYQAHQWIRGGMLEHFHDAPLVFDRRDREAEAAAVAKHLPPAGGKPVLLLCLKGHSSPFWARHDRPDDSAQRFEAWVRETFSARFAIVDVGSIVLPKPHHLLGLFERAAVLLSIDTLPIHLAYATGTPTVVLSRNHPWYMSEPRRHWAARTTYDKANDPAVREGLASVVNSLAGGPGEQPVGLCRPPAAMVRERVYHVTDAWIPPVGHPDRRRLVHARETWDATKDHDKGWTQVFHEVGRHARRTSRTELGDTRELPYIRDLIDFGCARAEADGRPDAVVVFTNSDVALCPEAPGIIRAAMAGGTSCAFSRRKDVVQAGPRRFTLDDLRSTPDHVGADLFAVRASWWRRHRAELPDLLMACEGWDFVARWMFRRHNPAAEMRTCIYHERHGSFWARADVVTSNPGQRHNRAECERWARANGLADALYASGSYLFKPDGQFRVDEPEAVAC